MARSTEPHLEVADPHCSSRTSFPHALALRTTGCNLPVSGASFGAAEQALMERIRHS